MSKKATKSATPASGAATKTPPSKGAPSPPASKAAQTSPESPPKGKGGVKGSKKK